MFYNLIYPLHEYLTFLNIFQYITFRTIYATLTAFLICLLLGPKVIKMLSKMQVGQYIRDDGPESHFNKAGTPTMGGVMIIFSIVVTILIWADLTNPYIWISIWVTLSFGLVGFIDDYMMQVKKKSKGLSALGKFVLLFVIALITGVMVYCTPGFSTEVIVPFFKNVKPDFGIFYIFFAAVVITGTSNAVNLTDGLDGLAIGPVVIVAVTYMVFSYVTGHGKMAGYLDITHIKLCGEMTVVCGALAGAGMGFLWFNSYPAQVFMGDVGSLSLGGLIGTIAVITKQEILLVIAGGLFVMEALSVIFQVGYFKITKGKRIFRMAPLHHHFELKGWPEPKVIIRFWIIAITLALISLSTLKIR